MNGLSHERSMTGLPSDPRKRRQHFEKVRKAREKHEKELKKRNDEFLKKHPELKNNPNYQYDKPIVYIDFIPQYAKSNKQKKKGIN